MTDMKLVAALAAAKCLISVDDNEQMYTVTLPKGYNPPQSIIRQWHTDSGNLGYGIKIVRAA